MDESDLQDFDDFVEKYWGEKAKKSKKVKVQKK